MTPARPSLAVSLIIWLLIQLAAVALAASGVRLSANFPRPPQSLAVHEMLTAQFVGSAMFLPVLFRGGWRAWLALALTAGPMLMLAAWLARVPPTRVLVLWGYVAAWSAMLALWRAVVAERITFEVPRGHGFQSPGLSSVLHGLAMLLSGGALLLWYLRSEFHPAAPPWLTDLFPVVAALRAVTAPAADLSPLRSTAVLCAAALVILAANASLRRASDSR